MKDDLYYKFSLPHFIHFSINSWENVHFELRSEKVSQRKRTQAVSGHVVVRLCDVILREGRAVQCPVHRVVLPCVQLPLEGCLAVDSTFRVLALRCVHLCKVVQSVGEC